MDKQSTVRCVLPRQITVRECYPKVLKVFMNERRQYTTVEYVVSSMLPDGRWVYVLNEDTVKGIHNVIIQEGTKG